MKLSTQDANLFFELMWPLQFFVNQRLQILPDVNTLEAYIQCPTEDKMPVREGLYEHIDLLDAFIQENPQHFSAEKLEIVGKSCRKSRPMSYPMRPHRRPLLRDRSPCHIAEPR